MIFSNGNDMPSAELIRYGRVWSRNAKELHGADWR